jgi:hypothetical protein
MAGDGERVERLGSCDDHDLKDLCIDYGEAKVTYSSTSLPRFASYVPHGWMHKPGGFDARSNRVTFDSVPAYHRLEWGRCGSSCKDSRTGCKLAVGPRSGKVWGTYSGRVERPYFHEEDGEIVEEHVTMTFERSFEPDTRMTDGWDCLYGKPGGPKCPDPKKVMMAGETPCAMNYCGVCKLGGYCRDGEKKVGCLLGRVMPLCAKTINVEDSCPTIGRSDARSTVDLVDAEDTQWKTARSTQQPGFEGEFFGAVTCSYAADAIETEEQLLRYMDLVGKDKAPSNLRFRSPLMESFCGRLIANTKLANTDDDTCLGNHLTGSPKVCSYYTSATTAGSHCRSWLNELLVARVGPHPQEFTRSYDDVIRSHCNTYPTLDECRCQQRQTDPLFTDLTDSAVQQSATFGNPGCWYKPCRAGAEDGMLLDSLIQNVVKINACDVTICSNVTTFLNSHYNNITGAEQVVSCDLSESKETNTSTTIGGGGGGGPAATGPATATATATATAPAESGGMLQAVADGAADGLDALTGGGSSWASENWLVLVGLGMAGLAGLALLAGWAASKRGGEKAAGAKGGSGAAAAPAPRKPIKVKGAGILSHLLSEEDAGGGEEKEEAAAKKPAKKKKKR